METLLTDWASHFGIASLRSLVRYLLIAGGAWLVIWKLLAHRLAHRKIQAGRPAPSTHLRELRDSVWSTLVIAVVTGISLVLHDHGMLKIYMDPMEHGLPWLAFTMFILVFGFDTWFYWSHRLMHHASLYSWTHEKHHEFTDPSPLAAYAFTAWEALAYALYAPLLLLVIPMNFWAMMVAGAWFTVAATMVHLGYELAPRWWGKSPLTRWIGTATMHNMHHEYTHYNFALYFTFWDRLMGTMHPEYDEILEEITSEPLTRRTVPPAAEA